MPAWAFGNPVPPEARLGKVLQNEFHILRVLGEGELGVTYEAENSRLKGKFAVLMLRRELKPTQGMMLSVQKDLRAAQPLQAQGLMPVKMIVDQFDIPGFATELLDGETLRQRLRRGPLRVERAIAIVLYVAKALDALHKAGAVHGDLRPENIFLVRPQAKSSFAGKVVIVEHSLHHLRRRPSGLDDQLPLYKLMYRPPELLAGETGPHPGGDVFVIGAILHECLTRRPAFFDEVADFVIDNLHQPPRTLSPNPQLGLTPELCKALDELTQCACARDPKERLPDMASLVVGLEALSKSKGLKLPEVLTEAPESASAESNQTEQRMHRLLERRSGVFPVLGPPPAEPVLPTVTKPAAPSPSPAPSSSPAPSPSPATSAPATSAPATSPAPSAKPAETLAPLQAITAPKKKVTQILQKLSSAFPVLTVSADGSAIEEHTIQPQVAKAPAEAVTLVGQPEPALRAEPPVPPQAQPQAQPQPQVPESKPVEAASVEAAPAKPEEPKPEEPKPQEPVSVVSVDAVTLPKAEAKPVLKANVAEALSRLRKPGLAVEPKGPPPAALPFEVAAITPVVTAIEPPKTAPPLAPPAPEPPKTAPPLAPPASAVVSDEKPVAATTKPPESKRRVSESTLQVDNVEDLLVSMPSLLAIPISPATPPLPPSAQSPKPPRIPEPPQTLSAVPTSAALESLRTSHDPALLSAPTQPLVPAMLGDLLTPPVTKPPVAPESLLTPPVTSPPPSLGALHEAPTRTKLPIDEISAVPTQAAVEAIPGLLPNLGLAVTPSVVPVIPLEAKPSGKISADSGDSIHDKPTAAVIPSIDLLSRVLAGSQSQPPSPSVPPSVPPPSVPPPSVPPPATVSPPIPASQPLPDAQRLLESNPIVKPEPPKEPLAHAESPKPDPKLVLPAQVSTAHTTLAPRAIPNKPVNVPPAPEPGLRALLLRHQELVAAGIGALIVLLIGLLFSVLIR